MNPIYKFELNRTTVNLLNPKKVVSGLLSTSNGQITSSTIYHSSDFIPVTPGTNYKLCDKDTFTSTAAPAACFYTANKTFISGSYGIANTPSNAAFMRVSFQGSGDDWGVFPSNVSSWSDYITPIAYPVYKDDLAKDFEKESNQEFFRAKLSGNLSFVGPDYDWIVGRAFDFQFVITVFISYNAGQTWTEYWRGTFWKTDCDFDDDAKTVSVKPTVWDQYNDVLAGLDKEYNLIELAPEIVPVKADKRPMIQVYVPGQSVIGCFLAGMWWEQECTPESDEFVLSQVGDGKLNFALNKTVLMGDISGNMSPQLPDIFTGVTTGGKFNPQQLGTQTFTNGDYSLIYDLTQNAEDYTVMWSILQTTTQQYLFRYQTLVPDIGQVPLLPQTLTLTPVAGSGATGNVSLYLHEMPVYSRYLCDTATFGGSQTSEIGENDIVPDNKNYRRVIVYNSPDTIYFSDRISNTPTQWGLYQPGQYYQPPYIIWNPELFPVARNAWGRVSVWFTFSAIDILIEQSGRQPFTVRHAYPLSSVISVLLAKVAPGITHEATTDYSQFLYGENLIGITQTLLITPKSNLVTAGYDQPAQKAPITLRNVLDMLRDCFRCYWFIDEQNRFRVEHIQYFRNGGSYSGLPVVGIDLTTQKVPRNGKEWAFARNQYKFDKPEMAARYQFGWMDDVTQLFEGYPIDIISKYVNPDNIEQIDVSRFTSDIDYILLNPSAVSKDGFALLAATQCDLKDFIFTRATVRESLPAGTSYENLKIDSTTRVTSELIWIDGNVSLSVPNSYDLLITLFDESGNYTGQYYGWIKQITLNNVKQIAITVRYSSNGEILPSNVPNGVFSSTPNKLKLPYRNFLIAGNDHYLQNAYVAFCFLQEYYSFDMPAPLYSINGEQKQAQGIKKLKNQQISFPVFTDPNLVQLVKTNLGNGVIEKLSVNLSSRNANATLKYDTEQ